LLALADVLALPELRGCHQPAAGQGGEFLEAVLARGGEGVVAKGLSEPFGATWFKCKRAITLDLIVKEADGFRASIRLADLATGDDRGWCPCRAAFDRVRVGDAVEVAAFGLTVKGKLREPRFVRIRADKALGLTSAG
jgi:ATP-dependent DNA ligase